MTTVRAAAKRAARSALGAALAAMLIAAAPAAAEDDPATAAREILEGGDYQTELPSVESPEIETLPPPPEAQALEIDLGSLAEALLWALAIAFGGLLIYAIVTHPALRRRLRGPKADEAAVATGQSADGGTDDADAMARADGLAQQGRLDEAVHLLLLGAIAELRRRLEPGLPESLTSREVLRRLELSGPARDAFAALVQAVERTLFGGRPAGPDDYDACKRSYRTLVGAEAA